MQKLTKERIAVVGVSVLAIGSLVGGSVWVANSLAPERERQVNYRLYEPAPEKNEGVVEPTPTATPVQEVAPEPAPAPDNPVVQPAAPVTPQEPTQQAPASPQPAPEPVAEPPAPAPAPEPEPAPVAVLCPGGSTSVSSDGFNDTACMPDVCFSLTLPDPTHPECDTPFRP